MAHIIGFLYPSLLLSFLSIMPQVYPVSFSMVRLHVVFGLSLFLFPPGVHLRVTFVMSSDGLRRTWPSHLHLFWINKISMSLVFVMSCRSLLEILFDQNIFIIFLRQALWKLENLLMSLSVIFQHSERYSSTYVLEKYPEPYKNTAFIRFNLGLLWKGCCLSDIISSDECWSLYLFHLHPLLLCSFLDN